MDVCDPYQLMPPLSPEEYQGLKDDIRARGVVRMPLIADENGVLLDGHHRKRIVEELRADGMKIDYMTIIIPGLSELEKRSHVRSLNLHRRQLSPEQRRDIIAEQLRDTPDRSDRLLASELHVDRETVGRVRAGLVATGGIPPVVRRVGKDGKARRDPSVIAHGQKETARALTALNGLDADVLPGHPVPVRLLERIRRETDSAARAAGIEAGSVCVGSVDIRCGDFRDVLLDLPGAGVDLVVADPPYEGQYLDLWPDLGDFCARVLRPGGFMVSYCGQQYLPQVMAALSARLRYVWMAAQVGHARKSHLYQHHIYSRYKPILVFARPPYKPGRWWEDLIQGCGPEKSLHPYQQNESEARALVESFSEVGDLVCDPMMGSGTTAAAALATGRRFVGCDVDARAVATVRERVRALVEGTD